MRASDPLPLATRRAAWDRLWRILLAPPRDDEQPPATVRPSPTLTALPSDPADPYDNGIR